ncbi:hypothetical protein BBF96_00875 [Anoxybacter fermentans]|uniref:Radical SAM core domain-containing protein n=1 Tax=Anoxybacter fermentans TaxID=1323375 RepID=A0A3Q9HNL8_9FIRM|nr:radical SAM protein [Anoxybacter fermentans]AZR72069.1 hypothetical protein BBF96_00875 [Anoxybacter fermentans]
MRVIREDLFFDYLYNKLVKSVKLRIGQGCSGECSFCNIREKEGEEVIYPPADKIKKGLLELWESGVRHLDFMDDTFLLNGDEMGNILRNLMERGVGFTFSIVSPVKTLIRNQKYLTPFKQLGLRRITLRVENSNEDVLSRYNIKATRADKQYAIQILQALRFQIHLHYILFEPLTTLEHLRNDFNFLEKYNLLGLVPFTDILTSYLDLDKDTPISREYGNRQLIKPSSNSLLPYQIFQKEVEEIFYWLLYFEKEFGKRFEDIYNKLLQFRIDLAKEKPNWALTHQGQELMYIILKLRMLPYELFKELLNSNNDQIAEGEMRRKCEIKLSEVEENYRCYRKCYNL